MFNQYFGSDASHKACPNGLIEASTSFTNAEKDVTFSYSQNRQP